MALVIELKRSGDGFVPGEAEVGVPGMTGRRVGEDAMLAVASSASRGPHGGDYRDQDYELPLLADADNREP